MKCNKDCLNCQLLRCVHDIEDRDEYVRDFQRKKDRERHAKYYLEHKAEIDAKQKEYDKKHRKAEQDHDYYMRHKLSINQKNRDRYKQNRVARLDQAKAYYWEHRDEINARRKRKRDQAKIVGGEK